MHYITPNTKKLQVGGKAIVILDKLTVSLYNTHEG